MLPSIPGLPLALSFLAALLLVAPLAHAQPAAAYQPPRTPEGRPDLQGVWGTGFMTALERPDDIKPLEVPPAEAAKLAAKFLTFTPEVVDPDANFITHFELAKVRGAFRTSLLVEPADGKLPLTPKARAIVARSNALGEYGFDNPEDRSTGERCIIGWGQAPLRPEHGYTPNRIVQTRDAIVLMTEDVGGLRIVDMTGHAPPDALRSYEGYSAGRWEGDTLVVVTTHLRADDPIRDQIGQTMIAGPSSRIIERFTRISDTELLEQFTIEDPEFYSRPWLAEFSLTRTDKFDYEYACHESNRSLTGMLRAARMNRQPKAPPAKK